MTDLRRRDAETLAGHYSDSAEGYAAFWSPVIRPVGFRLLSALPLAGAARVLDVGTGTGALLSAIQGFAPAAQLFGVDYSPGMLSQVRTPRVPLAVMDASQVGFRAGIFDVAVMAFMLFHIPDPVGTLAGVKRVLRPGGAVGVVTWHEDPLTQAETIWNEELDAAGAPAAVVTPRYHDLMNTTDKVERLLSDAGFKPGHVWIEQIDHQWVPEQLFGLKVRYGATKRRLDALAPQARAAFLERARSRLAALSPGDFLYRAATVCGVAVT